MNTLFSILMAFFCFTDINGQCPDTDVTVTECDVSIQTEHRVFVHFYQNNISCSCTVTSLFDGELHVMFSKPENRKKCYYNYNPYSVKVNDTVIKDCYREDHTMFNVQSNDFVIVKAKYIENNNSMNITPCLEIYGLKYEPNGSISVTCGNPQTTKPQTTKPITQPTTILKSSRTYSSAANNNNEADATTISYVASTSVDSTFKDSSNVDSDKQICEFSQIPLGIFIAIAIVSALLNIFFFYRIKSRNPFGTHKNKNRNTGTNQTTGHRNQTGAYSELNVGAIATGGTTDTENQYDALKHHDNYINMKCIGEKGTVKTSESKDCYININYVGNIN